MVRVIDIPADAISQRTTHQNVRKIMIASSETCDAYRARNSVSRDLHGRMIVIFVRDNRRQRPRLDAVPRRKRRSTVEEIAAALAPRGARALSDFLNCCDHNRTID